MSQKKPQKKNQFVFRKLHLVWCWYYVEFSMDSNTGNQQVYSKSFFCNVCLECIVPLENFSFIWRRHHCRWRASHFLPLLETRGLLVVRVFLACHIYYDTGHPFIMVNSEDPWHSRLSNSVWQWRCHYLILRLESMATSKTVESEIISLNSFAKIDLFIV